MQRLTLIYLSTYLLLGGLGLLLFPDLTLRLMQSNVAYGDVMPRVVGMFMLALGGVIFQFVRAQDYRYYLRRFEELLGELSERFGARVLSDRPFSPYSGCAQGLKPALQGWGIPVNPAEAS